MFERTSDRCKSEASGAIRLLLLAAVCASAAAVALEFLCAAAIVAARNRTIKMHNWSTSDQNDVETVFGVSGPRFEKGTFIGLKQENALRR